MSARRWARVLVDNCEELVAAGLLGAIGVVTVLQVCLRTVFGSPLGWPEELSQFLMVWASALGAVGAIKRAALVRVDYLVARLRPSLRRLFDGATLATVCGVLVVLGWTGWQLASRTATVATVLPITWTWAYAAAPVFSILGITRLLQVRCLGYRFALVEMEIGPRWMANAAPDGSDGPKSPA